MSAIASTKKGVEVAWVESSASITLFEVERLTGFMPTLRLSVADGVLGNHVIGGGDGESIRGGSNVSHFFRHPVLAGCLQDPGLVVIGDEKRVVVVELGAEPTVSTENGEKKPTEEMRQNPKHLMGSYPWKFSDFVGSDFELLFTTRF